MLDPCCHSESNPFGDLNRRDFLRMGAAGVAAGMVGPSLLKGSETDTSEKLVHKL